MEVFRSVESEFGRKVTSINKKLATNSDQQSMISVRTQLNEAEQALFRMEKLVSNFNTFEQDQYSKRVSRHKSTFNMLKRTFDLCFGRVQATNFHTPKQKQLFLTETSQNIALSRERALNYGMEAQEIGIGTLNQLKKQREQIHIIGDQVDSVRGNIKKVDSTVSKINRRRFCIRIILIGIIFLQISSICLIIYIKLL